MTLSGSPNHGYGKIWLRPLLHCRFGSHLMLRTRDLQGHDFLGRLLPMSACGTASLASWDIDPASTIMVYEMGVGSGRPQLLKPSASIGYHCRVLDAFG